MCLLLRFAGARLPERLGARRAVTIAFVTLAVALGGARRCSRTLGAVGVGRCSSASASAFLYPSLMALTVNRVDERERPMAISSFTMFFEVGTITGGVVLGLVAELLGKRASFGAAVVLCASARGCCGPASCRRPIAPSSRPSSTPAFVPVACD